MAQVMAFRRALLRRIRGAPLANTLSAISRDAWLSVAGLRTRQFAVLASNDRQVSAQTTLQRLTDASKLSWRLRAAVKDVEQSLPTDRGKRFYNRRLVEALEKSDYNRAWAIVETLHRRHPDTTMLWPYTYNLLLRHLCKQQKTLMNANLTRIMALLDAMVDYGCADRTSFQVAMAACSRARYLRGARHVFDKMEECGMEPDDRIYGFLINCCARKRGLVKIAEQYFDEMLTKGVQPTILVVNAMLRVYSRDCGRSKTMVELVKRAGDEFGEVPDTVTTRTMVHYLLKNGAMNGAVRFLRDVEKKFPLERSINLPITRQVVNAVVDACRQCGEWSGAEYTLTFVERVNEKTNDTSNDEKQTTVKLHQLVTQRDAMTMPVVWSLSEQDISRMSRPEQKSFFKHQNQHQSVERALERMHLGDTSSSKSHAMQKLSLKLKSKLQVLDEMIYTKTASAQDFNAVLGACGRQGKLKDAISVLAKMKQCAEAFPECAPTTWSYNAILNACAVSGDIRQVESIVNEMIENGLYPDQVTMNTVLKAHITHLKGSGCRSSQACLNTVMQALSFFEWCTGDQKLDSGAATYYSLFRLFATYLDKQSNSSSANKLGDDDTEDEHGVLNDGQEIELMSWMAEFITTTCRDAPIASLDVGVFNNALDYYRQLGDVDESFALFNLMIERGFEPDDTSLGLMFAACASQQQFEVGLNFLDHIMSANDYKPTLKVLTGAMQLCANSKNPDGAVELFRAIEMSGTFKPTIETYEPLVYAYARVGNVSGAWDIANEMETKLGRVSISIYNRILVACVEAAHPGRALEVLSVMRSKSGVTPDVISYNTALEAFVRAGERASWWRNNKSSWEEDASVEGGSDDRGEDCGEDFCYEDEDLLSDLNEDGTFITEVISADAELQQSNEAEQREKAAWVRASVMGILEEIQRSRVKPDMTTYERALAACKVNQDSEGVLSIFDRLFDRKRGHSTSVLKNHLVSDSTFSAYLEASSDLQDKDRVAEAPALLHKWHAETGQLPPLFLVMQLLDSLERVGEWRRAVRLLADMQSLFGVPPSVAVFNRVMQMCNRAEEYQLVAPIFATMQDAYRVYPDAESYVQRIYSEEKRENWVAATDFFVEMQKRCPSEEITHHQLQKIALGRYRVRQNEH